MEFLSKTAVDLRRAMSLAFAESWWLLVACLLAGTTVWQRVHLPDWLSAAAFGVFLVAALFVDLKWKEAARRPLLRRQVIQLSLLILCLIPTQCFLFEAWSGEFKSPYLAANLLPFGDASIQVCGAKSLLAAGELNVASADHPLAGCMLATLFRVTNQNYQATLILLAAFAGMAMFFAAREMWISGGVAAAVLFIFLSAVSVADSLPVFMRETPGFTFGCMGLASLLGGFRIASFSKSLCGLGLLTVALTIQAGAVAVVPLLAAYILYYFSRGQLRDLLLKAAAVAVVCGAAVGWNLSMRQAVAPEGAAYDGSASHVRNNSYALYGLAAGGKGWTQVLVDHIEIHQMRDLDERKRYVRTLFREKFAADPSVFFREVFRATGQGALRFADLFYPGFRPMPTVIPGTLAFLGFCSLLRSAWRREGPWAFLVVCAIGIILSAPFSLNESGHGHFAATFSFPAALAASAIGIFAKWIRKLRVASDAESVVLMWDREVAAAPANDRGFGVAAFFQAAFAVLLIASLSVFPLLATLRPGTPLLPEPKKMEDGERWREIVFYHNPRSGVVLGSENHGELVQSSSSLAIKLPALDKEIDLGEVLLPGEYFCEVFLPDEPQNFDFFLIFPEALRGKAGYFRAIVQPLSVSKRPRFNLYRVERYRVL